MQHREQQTRMATKRSEVHLHAVVAGSTGTHFHLAQLVLQQQGEGGELKGTAAKRTSR
jgi:hypothetical protein